MVADPVRGRIGNRTIDNLHMLGMQGAGTVCIYMARMKACTGRQLLILAYGYSSPHIYLYVWPAWPAWPNPSYLSDGSYSTSTSSGLVLRAFSILFFPGPWKNRGA